MKLRYLRIQNFRSCKDVKLWVNDLHALVGGNNAGKSTVLKALDFFFNPSTKSISEDSFWNKDTSLTIRIEAHFEELSETEKESLSTCLDDGVFKIARTASLGSALGDSGDGDDTKFSIGQEYLSRVASEDWLRVDCINGANIDEWWRQKESLKVADLDFGSFLGSAKPTVGLWKQKAIDFLRDNIAVIPMNVKWLPNPKGYSNVLKKNLPFFVLVPAVRDVNDESKGTKSSPFGKLLYAIIESVEEEKKQKVATIIQELSKQMNRSGGESRVPLIQDTEDQLNKLLGDFFKGVDLEIEFQTPSFETLLTTPKLIVDDGFRNAIEHKGHGLQRAVIFSILRRYAEFMSCPIPEGDRRSMFIAVEEPELYMHPQAQRTIRGVFKDLERGGAQIFFTTHSSLLVDVSYFDEIIRLESQIVEDEYEKRRETKAYQLSVPDLIEDIESRRPGLVGKVSEQSIRDLYAHAYNPRRSEGFFASKIILVEGATEEYALPIYAGALKGMGLDPHNISVVECGGKGPMDRLYRIFNELRIPCYLIFDYDAGNTDMECIRKSKELLSLCGFSDAEPPSDTIIEERFCCFRETWEKDLSSEIKDLSKLKAEAKQELGLNNDSGKPLIARYIARKLTQGDSPIVPPKIYAILKKAVAITWHQSCLSNKKP